MSAHDESEAFDAEPATTLSPGEPSSPLWLPALGAALFAAVGVWWFAGDEAAGDGAEPGKAAGAATAVAAPPEAAPPAVKPPPAPAPPAMVRPLPPLRPVGSAGAPSVSGKLDPEVIKRLQEAAAKRKAEAGH
ncbi:MAG: hypothetical protein KC731_07455 [Myxococcales bacterium]|nr:hypothetical protein [Myxococcales bacterium]